MWLERTTIWIWKFKENTHFIIKTNFTVLLSSSWNLFNSVCLFICLFVCLFVREGLSSLIIFFNKNRIYFYMRPKISGTYLLPTLCEHFDPSFRSLHFVFQEIAVNRPLCIKLGISTLWFAKLWKLPQIIAPHFHHRSSYSHY